MNDRLKELIIDVEKGRKTGLTALKELLNEELDSVLSKEVEPKVATGNTGKSSRMFKSKRE